MEPTLPDRYKILDELGAGGMGTVYKVFDSILDKVFALKVLRFDARSSPNEALRFQKEAKAAGNLVHKNIMKVIDFGVTSDEIPYMVLEFLEGQTLKDLILEEGPLPIDRAIPMISQIVSALECAHSQGVVHRDLKSHNIMVCESGADQPIVKLYDFGIAQISINNMTLTAPNAIVGTPVYMSPEQAQGGKVDHRTDIYSLGCVLFEMLTGEPPFKGESSLELLDQHINRPAQLIGKIIPALSGHVLEEVVQRCLEKKPHNRFQDAGEILQQMNSLVLKSETPLEVAPPKTGNANPELRAVAGVAVALLILFGLALFITLKVITPLKDEPVSSTSPIAPAPALDRSIDLEKELDPKYHMIDTTLDLKQSQYADEVLSKIAQSTVKVKRVLLDHATISDKGMAALAMLKSVKRIEADGLTGVTAGGISKLKKLSSLETLHLQNFLVPDPAFDIVGDLKGLKEFVGTDFDEHRFQVISKLPDLELFRVENVVADQNSLKILSRLKNLNVIDLNKCSKLDSKALGLLASLSRLHHFELNKTPLLKRLNDNPLNHISKFRGLRTLGLEYDNLTDEDMDLIKSMNTLRTLKLNGNDKLTDEALRKIEKLELEKLHVDGCDQISDDAIETYKRCHPQCEVKVKRSVENE